MIHHWYDPTTIIPFGDHGFMSYEGNIVLDEYFFELWERQHFGGVTVVPYAPSWGAFCSVEIGGSAFHVGAPCVTR